MERRAFLKGTLAIATAVGLLRTTGHAVVAKPREAFAARSEMAVLTALFGDTRVIPGTAVTISAPLQAASNTAIPFKVSCDLHAVEMIAIVSADNRQPLKTYVSLFGANGYYSTRVKLERTSTVTAYVKAGGRLHAAATRIKINRGGYGVHFD